MESFDSTAIANHPWIGNMARAALANEGQLFMNALIRISADDATTNADKAVAQAGLRTLGGILSRAGIPNDYGNQNMGTMPGTGDNNPTAFLIEMLISSDEWPAAVTYDAIKAAFLAGTASGVMRGIIQDHLYAKAGIDSLTPSAQAMAPSSKSSQDEGEK